MSAKAATGVGTEVDVSNYGKVMVAIATASSGNLTVKACGSMEAPGGVDFSAAASPSNPHDFVSMKDLEDAANVDGDTGFVVAGTDDCRQFEINTTGLRTLNFNVTARSAGSVTVIVYPIENR